MDQIKGRTFHFGVIVLHQLTKKDCEVPSRPSYSINHVLETTTCICRKQIRTGYKE
jgi:hypothetical protein